MKPFEFSACTGLILGALSLPAMASAETTDRSQIRTFVSEAARKFDVPEAWVWAVMHVESRGYRMAHSPKGAMGLMQLMPATWSRLQLRLGLGTDPYDVRDNILAGTAYLQELNNLYGEAGVFAAYNAGPGRYEDYVARGRNLPLETRNYINAIHEFLGLQSIEFATLVTPARRNPPPLDTIFVESHNANSLTHASGFSTQLTPFVTGTKSSKEP